MDNTTNAERLMLAMNSLRSDAYVCRKFGGELATIERVANTPNPVRAEQPEGKGATFADGVKACIAWVEQRRHDFEAEHGVIDQTTNAMWFRNTGDEEYDCELAEIEEGLRAMLAAAPAAPGVRVDDVFMVPKVPSQEWLDTFANRLGIDSADAQNILAALAPDGGEGE